MIFDTRTYSALVVSASEKFNALLSPLLTESGFSPVIYAPNVSAAKRKFLEKNYDIVIINSPLPDDHGNSFAVDVCHSKNSVCMIIVKNDILEETNSRLIEQGVFVMGKPFATGTLSMALMWLKSARERMRASEEKLPSLEQKMEEIRLVNRAKWILIESEGMSEEEAHRYIEKTAMDTSSSKRSIAEKIISSKEKI
ncbi:MAG: ANTAR domain-containing protein [Lachnospiraceae bacterium]|nr:ANTAR domain-containing protein [Lachnospiraceae bacterium]